jgi:hypothetical protein
VIWVMYEEEEGEERFHVLFKIQMRIRPKPIGSSWCLAIADMGNHYLEHRSGFKSSFSDSGICSLPIRRLSRFIYALITTLGWSRQNPCNREGHLCWQ